jgi:hypothetical protein
LLWEPPTIDDIDLRHFQAEGVPVRSAQFLVLDGQQRLTALWKVCEGDMALRFHPLEEEVAVENAANRKAKEWLPVGEVLRWSAKDVYREALERFGQARLDQALEAISRLQRVLDYQYRVCTLRTEDYTAVVESFVRLNSGGVPLRQAELAMATLLLGVPGFYVQRVDDLTHQLAEKHDFECGVTFLMRCFAAVLTDQGRLRSLRRELETTREADIRAAWDRMENGLYQVVAEVLADGLSRKQLPSLNLLVPLVYFRAYHDRVSTRDHDLTRGWLYLASARGRYSGAVETTLSEDLRALKEGGPYKMAVDLISTPGGISVAASELLGPYQRHPFLLLLYAVVRERGGRDLFTGLPLSRGGPEPTVPEFHRFFPRAFVRKQLGLDHRAADELANIGFLAQRSNQQVSDKAPAEYLAALDEDRLRGQFVPLDRNCWEGTREGFQGFLRRRREVVAQAGTEFLGGLLKGVQRDS